MAITNLRLLLLGAVALLSSHLAEAQAPYAKTQTAAPVRATTAILNGMAVPRGQPTYAWFEWGTNTAYGNLTPPQYISNGTHVVRVTNLLTGLTEGVYHFRLVASNSVSVTRGFDFMFTTSMKVQNWGPWDNTRPVIPTGVLSNISGVTGGHRHTIAVHNDGTVVVWPVGVPVNQNYGQTIVPAGLSNVVSVAGGFSHCVALTESGALVPWGGYADGSFPTVPAGISNVIAVSAGDYFSAALKSDGTVSAWGKNIEGVATNVPFGLVDVVAISCGTAHTLALKADGTVVVWGADQGAITAPSSATNLVAVATMGWWNIALRGDGTTVEWGSALYPDVPKPSNVSNVVAVATGYGSAEALKADGTIVAWGRIQDVLAVPAALSNVIAIASGDYYMTGLGACDLPPRGNPVGGRGTTNVPITLSLSGFDPNGDPLAFRITALPSTGSLYQYTSNGLGDQILTPDTYVTNSSRVMFMPAPGVYGDPSDSFVFVANDGILDSTPVTVSVATVPPPFIQNAIFSSGPTSSVTLNFLAVSNATYSVWRSTNLTSWISLGAPVQSSPGQFTFTDYTISNTAVRFYRIRAP